MSGPLEGLIVADFSRVLAGPYATMLLGDLGATVIKVERPGTGDDTRTCSPPVDDHGDATYFLSVNRNKYSVAWDLDEAADRARARDLAERADIFIENFPAGALDKRDLGYDDVASINADVIYCSISGFGPEADLPGYDLLVQAMGGLMDITGDTEPTKAGVAIVDVITGLHAVNAILAALHHRDRTGEGQHLEVTLLGSLLSALVNQTGSAAITGESPERMGNAHPSVSPYEPYPTADRPIVIAVGNDQQFARLCEALQHPDWAIDPRFATNTARVDNRELLRTLLTDALQTRGADEWQSLLNAVRVPCGPINTVNQALELADRLNLTPIIEIDGVMQIANPVRYSRTPVTYRLRPPHLGEHCIDEVLG
ncbi:MAG: CoA transferase [Actinomycetota bacterium]|nr:CoA transferase [Actinomycetota bacterium]